MVYVFDGVVCVLVLLLACGLVGVLSLGFGWNAGCWVVASGCFLVCLG